MSRPPVKNVLDEQGDDDLSNVEGDVIEIDPIDVVGDPGGSPPPPPEGFARFRTDEIPNKDDVLDIVARGIGLPGISAGAQHFGQAATFGFGDELAGAGDAALGRDYEDTRDRVRGNLDAYAEEQPVASGIGTGLGILATLPVLGGLPAAESMGGRLGLAVAEGAGMGALGAAGDSEADLLEGDVGGLRDDISEGVLGGAVTGGLFGAASEGGRRLVNRLRGRAPERLQEAARQRIRRVGAEGVPELRKVERALGEPERIADDLRGRGVSSLDDLQAAQREAGAVLGDVKRRVARQPVDLSPAIQRINEALSDIPQIRGSDTIRNAMRRLREDLRKMQGRAATFDEIDQLRSFLGQSRSDAARNANTPLADALNAAEGGIIQSLQNTVGRHAPDAADAYEAARRTWRMGRVFGDVAEDAERRGSARSPIGLYDLLGFGGGFGIGEALGGEGGGGSATGLATALALRGARSPRAREALNRALGNMGTRAAEGSGGDVLEMLRRVVGMTDGPEAVGELALSESPAQPVDKDLALDPGVEAELAGEPEVDPAIDPELEELLAEEEPIQ